MTGGTAGGTTGEQPPVLPRALGRIRLRRRLRHWCHEDGKCSIGGGWTSVRTPLRLASQIGCNEENDRETTDPRREAATGIQPLG